MIRELAQSNANNLAFEVIGKVSIEDEKGWIEMLDEKTKAYDKVNVMVVLGKNASWGLEAGIADIKWIVKHMDKFNRLAFVADSKVWKWLIKVDSFFAQFVDIEEKYFESNDIDKAWEWVSA